LKWIYETHKWLILAVAISVPKTTVFEIQTHQRLPEATKTQDFALDY
jgi:hypothetical protein